MVDLGIAFNDAVGIEVVMPNPQFITERRDQLKGLVLTHAHEDHIGAVPYIWPMLKCPIYTSPFTAAIVRGKLEDAGLKNVPLHEIPLDQSFKVGSFEIDFVQLTHSIPEPNALVITTPAGRIFHTGDWKFDPDPVVGEEANFEQLKKIGDTGILAMICDSTNVFTEGASGSEADVREELVEAISHYPHGKVIVSCFASNVARLDSIVYAAKKCNRKVILTGRSFLRMHDVSTRLGYLDFSKDTFIELADAKKYPPQQILLVCTGSQGEYRAMLSRLARNALQDIALEEGDAVIFSSRMIPGNEGRIHALKNSLIRQGVHVVTQRHFDIHVSGHPARDDLIKMYEMIRPKVAIPVHGELQHMVEHGRLAKKCQVEEIVIAENGTMVRLAPGLAEVLEDVPSGRLGVDGTVLVSLDHASIKERRKLSTLGTIFISVCGDGKAALTFSGIINAENFYEKAEKEVLSVLDDMGLYDDVAEEIRIRVRRLAQALLGKKPVTIVHLFDD